MQLLRSMLLVAAPSVLLFGCAPGGEQPTGSASSSSGGRIDTASQCPSCVTDLDCASGSKCGQFGGDTYCAPDCSQSSCASDRTCTDITNAEGKQEQLCVPNVNLCGEDPSAQSSPVKGHTVKCTSLRAPSEAACCTTCTPPAAFCQANGCTSGRVCNVDTCLCQKLPKSCSAGTGSGSSSSSSTGGASCAHPLCSAGANLDPSCDPCVTTLCGTDAYCCNTKWDATCVAEVASICGQSCGGSTSSSSSSSTSSSSSSSSSSSTSSSGGGGGGVTGLTGGKLDTLSFAIVGDTRPPIIEDTAGFPTAICTKIWQDVDAYSPRPAFAVTTGDYMFAKANGSQAAPQLDKYLSARSAFTNTTFPTMGNHECTGATTSNCGQGNANGITNNYTAFMSKMLAPLGVTRPYYTLNVGAKNGSWSAKFLFVAANAWDAVQSSWLDAEMAKPTTYTFVVRHESTTATQAPGVKPSAQIMAQHPYTLLLAGHAHTFAYMPSSHEVIVGNGGAPLAGAINYGYVIAQQRADGAMVFQELDYSTNAVQTTFVVTADGTPTQ